jgi:hypothetical protein
LISSLFPFFLDFAWRYMPDSDLDGIGRSGDNRRSPALPCARSEGRMDVPRPTADKGRRNAWGQVFELVTSADPFS